MRFSNAILSLSYPLFLPDRNFTLAPGWTEIASAYGRYSNGDNDHFAVTPSHPHFQLTKEQGRSCQDLGCRIAELMPEPFENHASRTSRLQRCYASLMQNLERLQDGISDRGSEEQALKINPMSTLTGYDASPKSPDAWRDYIQQLHAQRDAIEQRYRAAKAHPSTNRENCHRLLSRFDVLTEHISRAKMSLESSEKANRR